MEQKQLESDTDESLEEVVKILKDMIALTEDTIKNITGGGIPNT